MLQEKFEYIDDLDEVDQLLNDFNSGRRMSAFYTSARLVELIISKVGLLNFFESMTMISETVEIPTFAFTATAKSGRA